MFSVDIKPKPSFSSQNLHGKRYYPAARMLVGLYCGTRSAKRRVHIKYNQQTLKFKLDYQVCVSVTGYSIYPMPSVSISLTINITVLPFRTSLNEGAMDWRINDHLSKLLLAIEWCICLSRTDEICWCRFYNSMCVNDVFGFI